MLSPRVKLTRFLGPRTSVYGYYGRFFTPYSFENVSPSAAACINPPAPRVPIRRPRRRRRRNAPPARTRSLPAPRSILRASAIRSTSSAASSRSVPPNSACASCRRTPRTGSTTSRSEQRTSINTSITTTAGRRSLPRTSCDRWHGTAARISRLRRRKPKSRTARRNSWRNASGKRPIGFLRITISAGQSAGDCCATIREGATFRSTASTAAASRRSRATTRSMPAFKPPCKTRTARPRREASARTAAR